MHLREYLKQPDQSQQKLASRLRVSQGLISQWLNWLEGRSANATKLAPEQAQRIEMATGGEVRCEELRPDVQWTRDDVGVITGYHVALPQANDPAESSEHPPRPFRGDAAPPEREAA